MSFIVYYFYTVRLHLFPHKMTLSNGIISYFSEELVKGNMVIAGRLCFANLCVTTNWNFVTQKHEFYFYEMIFTGDPFFPYQLVYVTM